MKNQQEEWRTITFAPDYEVSSKGRVRRVNPDWQGKYAGHVLKPGKDRRGNHGYVLCHDGKKTTKKVHRLVCEAFTGHCPPDKAHCAHRDGNVDNNTPENLYWATPKENCADRDRHGTTARGERNGNFVDGLSRLPPLRPKEECRGEAMPAAKLTEEQAQAILGAPQYHGVGRDLAERYGVSMGLISAIRKGRAWSYLRQGPGKASPQQPVGE